MKLILLAILSMALFAMTEAGHLRSLGRKSRTKDIPEICEYIYGLEFKGDFSQCMNEATVSGQQGANCSDPELQSYDACASRLECSWWHLNGANVCMANPCYRINNGLCTIQNTGGRCVWYTREQNLVVNGVNAPGCYKSPCHNPLENTPKGCAAKGNEFYDCTWCPKYDGQAYGCMNAKANSTAQCWNVSGEGALPGCTKCAQSYNGTCESDRCKSNCCQSPFCTCDLSDNSRDPNGIANNIIDG